MVFAPDSSLHPTAKRLQDSTLSNHAFAIFFIVTILIAITLLVASKAGAHATNQNGQNTAIDFNTGANWRGGQAPGLGDMAPTKASGSQSFILKTLQNQRSKSFGMLSPYYHE
jgi:hypothetical protein